MTYYLRLLSNTVFSCPHKLIKDFLQLQKTATTLLWISLIWETTQHLGKEGSVIKMAVRSSPALPAAITYERGNVANKVNLSLLHKNVLFLE